MENVLNILFCLTLLYLGTTTRIMAYLNVFVTQGILLFVILILPLFNKFSAYTFILPVMILAVKAVLIPIFIKRKIMLELEVRKSIESDFQQFNFLLLCVFTMITVFVSANMLAKYTLIDSIPFAAAFSTIIIGLYIIIFRKKLIVHVIGFLVMENGIFLLGVSIASEMPFLIELISLLDIFVAVFLMGIAINKISSTFAVDDITGLDELKD
ncbi:MAG: hypothetical protein WCJ01_06690 [Ignavibacteria bacterium]